MKAVRVEALGGPERSGIDQSPIPFTVGVEGARVVEAVGEGVRNVKRSDRVAFTGIQGAYAEAILAGRRCDSRRRGKDDVQGQSRSGSSPRHIVIFDASRRRDQCAGNRKTQQNSIDTLANLAPDMNHDLCSATRS
jgi:threonine dehydrogenase-like Zn-dependent dehydrogenase